MLKTSFNKFILYFRFVYIHIHLEDRVWNLVSIILHLISDTLSEPVPHKFRKQTNKQTKKHQTAQQSSGFLQS